MKKISLFIILIVVVTTGHAQDTSHQLKRHEIGLNLFSYMNSANHTSTGVDFRGDLPTYSFVNGLSYKFHFKKSALRANFTYQKVVFPDYNTDEYILGKYYWGQVVNKELRVGYERELGTKKLKPYVALDFWYAHSFNDGKMLTSCYFDPLCDPFFYNSSTTVLGFIPSFGLSYQFNKWISVRMETSATVGAYQNVTMPIFHSNKYYSKVEGVIAFNPISVFSVNVHF